jgi:hypothetical protein
MKKTHLALAALVATGLAVTPFAAEAKSHKAKQHSMSSSPSQTTTGANMKSKSTAKNPSSSGNAGPGTDQGASMPPTTSTK